MPKGAIEALQEASALFAAGRLEEARRACRKLLTKRPDIAEAHVLMAELHGLAGDESRARQCSARARKLRPSWTEAHLQLVMGDLLADFQRYDEAEARYRNALVLDPGFLDARYNLAAVLNATGRNADAASELQALLDRDERADDARQQLVHLLQELRRFEDMEIVCRDGIALHPASSFYQSKVGIALCWQDRHEEALCAFRAAGERAIGGDEGDEFAGARFLEASTLLTLGQYREGWDAYRWRRTRRALALSTPALPKDPRTLAAASTPKRIRIIPEQGLGDELFFLRFAPMLAAGGHQLSMQFPPKLAQIAAGMSEFIVCEYGPARQVDLTLASGDLPSASGAHFAPPLPLHVDPERRTKMHAELRSFGPPPYIAVTWRGGLMPDEPKPEGIRYFAKQLPPELLAAALRPLDARVIVVQRRPQTDEARRFAEAVGRPVLDLSSINDDLREALALLSLVDEYIGLSNTNMHLRAGLEGKTARVLVPTPPEWRWGLKGTSSPWFPTFTLYRAGAGRDWSEALSRLGKELSAALRAAASQQD